MWCVRAAEPTRFAQAKAISDGHHDYYDMERYLFAALIAQRQSY
jgi:hypothetical protein